MHHILLLLLLSHLRLHDLLTHHNCISVCVSESSFSSSSASAYIPMYMALVDLCIVVEINWGHIFNVLIFSILESTFNWNLDRNWQFALKIRVVSIWLSFSIKQNRSTLTISVLAANSEINRKSNGEREVRLPSFPCSKSCDFHFCPKDSFQSIALSLWLWLDRCLSLKTQNHCVLYSIIIQRIDIRGQIYFSVHFDEFSEKEMFGKENGKFNGKSIDSILKRVPRKYL